MSDPVPQDAIFRPIAASDTYDLRHTILWPEKPFSYVILEEDETGQHFGAFVSPPGSDDELIGIISLFIKDSGEARFRKFAMKPEWQGKGIGSRLLNHAIEVATRAGANHIWCDARQSALPFYQRFGMQSHGDVFYKGDIPYLRMRRSLP